MSEEHTEAGPGSFTAIPDYPEPRTSSSSFSEGHMVLNDGTSADSVCAPERLKSTGMSSNWSLTWPEVQVIVDQKA